MVGNDYISLDKDAKWIYIPQQHCVLAEDSFLAQWGQHAEFGLATQPSSISAVSYVYFSKLRG